MRFCIEAPGVGTEKSFGVCQVGTQMPATLQCRDSSLPLRLTFWKAEPLMGNHDPQPV